MIESHFVLDVDKLRKTFPDRKVTAGYYTRPVNGNGLEEGAAGGDSESLTGDHLFAGGGGRVHNHKPKIHKCNSLTATVKEEQPIGTFIVQVYAEDVDVNDQIEFSLVKSATERNQLTIDPKTGRIFTNHVFDRDEPIREKQLYATVRATDDGSPPLDDVCTFKIQIEDINDNAPMFDKTRYEEVVSRDTKVNATVMRISASDFDDGENSVVNFKILREKDWESFGIDPDNGLIHLRRGITRSPGKAYTIIVRAFNTVKDAPQEATTTVRFRVIESNRRAPRFSNVPREPLIINENFSNFSMELLKIKAESNVPNSPELIFELLTGRTEQSNSKNTFVFSQENDEAIIRLGSSLDYESITDYCLTLRVKNVHDLSAELPIKIKLRDVNDNIPYFVEVTSGTVLENEEPKASVLQVRALDMDGTIANNIVKYKLADHMDSFEIDIFTGEIRSLVEFDREVKDFYNVKVVAYDNSPSQLYDKNEENRPNRAHQVFRIEIGDKNDHPPVFVQDNYYVDRLPEDTNTNHLVLEVLATDRDTASVIQYRIVEGNVGNSFKIDALTGKISVAELLDYEKIKEYNLKVRAYDGIYEAFTRVQIKVENMNDNPPKFCEKFEVSVNEGETYNNNQTCILRLMAYDPDIQDRNSPQNIVFSIVKAEQRSKFHVDEDNCFRIKVALDRDPPHGFKDWHVLVAAVDEKGEGLKAVTEVVVHLVDINDNAPFLTTQMPVVWMENQRPGDIVQLQAEDYDETKNGPPFQFQLDPRSTLGDKFSVSTEGVVQALVQFDREEIKEYFLPIVISDSGYPHRMLNTSTLHVVIGDENDNPMVSGASEIFVTTLITDQLYEIEIGMVFVDDPDDWDLNDKRFYWRGTGAAEKFRLDEKTGRIYMSSAVRDWTHVKLEFDVVEESRHFPKHTVDSVVWVNIKQIPEEAVIRSGSVRFLDARAEEFVVAKNGQKSALYKFQKILASLFHLQMENVDIVTVKNVPPNFLDVRFSVHASPYYHPDKLNAMIEMERAYVERELGMQIFMVSVNECELVDELLVENGQCRHCDNKLKILDGSPVLVATNRTSFVSVNAFSVAECVNKCEADKIGGGGRVCYNGGSSGSDNNNDLENDVNCECASEEFNGPRCELTSATFSGVSSTSPGHSFSLYSALNVCDLDSISLSVKSGSDNGLIFYSGPISHNPHIRHDREFIAFELRHGHPTLTVQYADGAVQLKEARRIVHNEFHRLTLKFDERRVEMIMDDCTSSHCLNLGESDGLAKQLRKRNPLQFGSAINQRHFNELSSQYRWQHTPQGTGFLGCISNVSINDGNNIFDFNEPVLSENMQKGCSAITPLAGVIVPSLIGYWWLWLLIILFLMLLVWAVLVLAARRKSTLASEHQNGLLQCKEFDDNRDSIIHYEYEGGGEEDTTNFNRNMLMSSNQQFLTKSCRVPTEMDKQIEEIGNFLTEQKFAVDQTDAGNVASAWDVDNVRLYAYEGEGASSCASLSSLEMSQGTNEDDEDLNFDYLPHLGLRFRKLAHLYASTGEDEAQVEERERVKFYECTDV